MTITATHRARYEATRERCRTAREARTRARTAHEAARQAGDDDAIGVTELALQQADLEVDTADALRDQLLRVLPGAVSSIGVTMREDPQAQATLAEIANSNVPLSNYVKIGEFATAEELAQMGGRAINAAVTLPAEPSGGMGLGVQPVAQPPLNLLDLFPSIPQTERIVGWLQRNGVAKAAVAPHGSVKAQAALTYVDQSEEAQTVAVWVKMNRQDLADYEGVAADLDQALSYGVRAEEESLLVDAILAATGIHIPDFTGFTVENAIDRIIVATAQQRVTGANVTFAAFNPLDAAVLAIDKGSDGHYTFANSPFGPGGPLNGVSPVQSPGLARGTALIGDSGISAKLGIRSGLAVFAGQEQDDLTRNRVTLLAEARVTPMVTVPSAFSKVALA